MAPPFQQPPVQPRWPLAIRNETITTAEPETIITVRNSPEPWHPLDYTVTHENGATLFTVNGNPWGLAQRRIFRDASGLPLFELRGRWYDSSTLELKLPGGAATSETLLSAKCRVAVQAPRAVLRFRNSCVPLNARPTQKHKNKKSVLDTLMRPSTVDPETVHREVMEIYSMDVDNFAQVAVVDGQRVANIDRVTDPGELAQGQKPPFRFRPMWRVRVARGVDLALMAVAVVIVGQQAAGDGLVDQ
ncbi:uncharacterized protein APUU_80270S [Aspergillus puulaauensis]|uniref:Tubby C-terminal-like domain-containing protein n=1 Tax=Aspergillus puulaauensis TaxID=1220207 RepID=A0A7R8AT93_9EURO|nr:uncharacterized protein APUU_80270S [Aspergillus puulaauensis]BCS29967.1 hypothetical protein APUU_80270S [Aspergillus puulaauensis]